MTFLKNTIVRTAIFHLILIIGNLLFSQIIISEILFNPLCELTNQEFVEIYNNSGVPVDLSGWILSDNHSTDELLPEDPVLPADEFAVILEQDYEYCFDSIFPDEVNIIYVDDNSIGNGLGNSSDQILIQDTEGDSIAYTTWEVSVQPGHSLERISFQFPDLPQNWHESVDISGTPGMENSVASYTYDSSIDSAWVIPVNPHKGQSYNIFALLHNNGLLQNESLILINDSSFATIALEPFQVDTLFLIQDEKDISGSYPYFLRLITTGDYQAFNDTISISVNIPYDFQDVLINEIMYDPISGNPEWIEIENQTGDEISLLNWEVNDEDIYDNNRIFENYSVDSDNYAVITKSQSEGIMIFQEGFPGLNNNEDNLYLFDHTGKMIDHVHYQSAWGGGDGFSLERITRYLESNNPENWGTSVADSGNTAWSQNSLFTELINSTGHIIVDPNPFSPAAGGTENELTISYNIPFPQIYLNAVIYDVRGRKQITLQNDRSAAQGIIRWDGKRTDGRSCVTGQYILVMQAKDYWSNRVWKGTERIIVVNH